MDISFGLQTPCVGVLFVLSEVDVIRLLFCRQTVFLLHTVFCFLCDTVDFWEWVVLHCCDKSGVACGKDQGACLFVLEEVFMLFGEWKHV